MKAHARRAHTKSRNGCESCKTRKVKCDEAVPCLRCVRRGDKCSLVSSSSAAPSPTPISSIGPTAEPSLSSQNEIFTLTDIHLFHRFTSATCHYLANPNKCSPWLIEIPALSTAHPFLLHEMMALAAVDLSREIPSAATTATDYLSLARHHHAAALAGLMPAITSRSPELVAPVWACNSLFVPYYFATAPADDPASLLYSPEPNPGPAEWMLPLRGGVTIWKANEDVLLGGAMGLHLRPYQQNLQAGFAEGSEGNSPSEGVLARIVEQLSERSVLERGEGKREDADEELVTAEAFRLLRHCFRVSDRDDALAKKTASLTFCATAPGLFFEMLARKRTGSLVVMAFWCVLLHRAEKGNWWMSFKSDRLKDLLGFIADMLGPKRRELIVWPLEQVLGPEQSSIVENGADTDPASQ